MYHRFFKSFLLLLLALILTCPAFAAHPKTVLIIDIPRLLYSDITQDYPTLYHFANQSAAGMMALPNLEPKSPQKIYLELNSGNSLKTTDEGFITLQVSEDYKGMAAGNLFKTLTGRNYPPQGAVNIGMPKLIQLNMTHGNNAASIGLFGKVLHAHSIKTAVIGNADIDQENLDRSGAILLMDDKGIIDYAAIDSKTMAPDPKFVFGIKTDPRHVLAAWEGFRNKADIIQIILGDLERINKFSSYLPEERLEFHRRQALRHYDRLIGDILNEVDFRQTMVLIMSVAGPDSAKTGAKLNPVLIRTNGLHRGYLYSDSTRRASLVTGYDIMATILNYVGIRKDPGYYKGRNLTSVPGRWQNVAATREKMIVNYDLRWPILSVYGYLVIALLALFTLGLIFWSRNQVLFNWIKYIYLFLLTIPTVFLAEAYFDPVDWVKVTLFTATGAAMIMGFALWAAKRDLMRACGIVCAITVLAVIIDSFNNGYAQLRSFWGYSAVAGARFYGVGNEYMGFLLGAYIVGLTIGFNRIPERFKRLLWPTTVVIAVLLAHPALGANIGGGITAIVGLGVANYLWLKRPVGLREILVLVASFVVLLLFIGFWDLSLNGKVTHFGQFIKALHDQGTPALLQMISNKLEMNLQLIEYTPLSRILILFLLVIPVLYKKPPRILAGWLTKYQLEMRGLLGLSLTALVALLVNDSGIVSVATMFIFGLYPIILLLLKEKSS